MVVLVVIGVLLGLVLGGWLACLWGLRRARDGRPALLLVGFAVLPIACSWAAEGLGWPTPGSIARSTGAVSGAADGTVLAAVIGVSAVVVVTMLVRSGRVRRLERWASPAGAEPVGGESVSGRRPGATEPPRPSR